MGLLRKLSRRKNAGEYRLPFGFEVHTKTDQGKITQVLNISKNAQARKEEADPNTLASALREHFDKSDVDADDDHPGTKPIMSATGLTKLIGELGSTGDKAMGGRGGSRTSSKIGAAKIH